jgi:hypothetical protein
MKPMNCHDAQESLGAWLDRECDEPERAALEAHLEQCAGCRGLAESLQAQDRQLREALAADRAAAQRITDQVVQKLSTDGVAPLPSSASRWPLREWFMLVWAAAAGFLLAVWLFAPRPGNNPASPPVAESSSPPSSTDPGATDPAAAAAIAQFVASTGAVEVFDPQRSAWFPVSNNMSVYMCPESRVRTADNVQCELRTNEGCVIRMNDETEITLAGSSSIDLQKGQIWCQAPQEVALEVRVSGGQNRQPQPVMWSTGPSCAVTGIHEQGQVQVLNAAGQIHVRSHDGDQELRPGELAEIIGGKLQTENAVSPLLFDRWIHPLLMQKGPGNEELEQRVNGMLAQIGRTKIEVLYEQEIRALGEHAVLPLVRYLRSPLSQQQPNRYAAMRLAADLAPVWLIPDFIELLKDEDPEIRVAAAQTLQRLTGLHMDRNAEDWRGNPSELAPTIERWGTWWQTHRHQFPSPTVRFTD